MFSTCAEGRQAGIISISELTTDESRIQCGVWALPGCAQPDIGWVGEGKHVASV